MSERATALVVPVAAATGARAAAAALACAGAEPDRAGLLIDLTGTRGPRPSLVATGGARGLEERLAAHLPEAGLASRGRICHLTLPADAAGVEQIAATLPLARDSVAVVLLSPQLLQPTLAAPGVRPAAAMLRADLPADRALTALVAGDLIERGLRVAVLKQPLGWLWGRVAMHGVEGRLPARLVERLLPPSSHERYSVAHDQTPEPEGAAKQERRDHAGARRGRGIHRHPERGPGR